MQRPLRILVALPPLEEYSPATGGAVSTITEVLARYWTASGHDVVVLSQRTDEPYVTGSVRYLRYTLPETRPLRRLRLGAVRRLRRYDWPLYSDYISDVRRSLAETRPDWLVLHNDLVLPALRSSGTGHRTALTLHNSVNSNSPARARRAILRSDAVTAVSRFIAEETALRLSLPPGVVRVINNGVDNPLYGCEHEQGKLAPEEPLKVAVLGRLLYDKGAHVLLQAVRLLAEEGIVMIPSVVGSEGFRRSHTGESTYGSQVAAEAARLGGGHVPHLGRQHVADLLRQQDIVVVPSLFDDPFPLVVLEGMASGCAVVVSDRGGLPEAAGDAGVVVPADEPRALANVLRTLHTDREELARRQRASLARAAAYDWAAVADAWLELFAECEA